MSRGRCRASRCAASYSSSGHGASRSTKSFCAPRSTRTRMASSSSPLSAANSGLRRTHRAGLRGVHLEERGLLAADPSARPRPCLAPAPRTARLTPSSRRRRGELLNTEVMPSAGVANDSVGESMELFATTDVDLNGTSISSSTSRTTLTSMNAGGVPRRPHGRASGLTPGPEPRAADGRTRGSSRVLEGRGLLVPPRRWLLGRHGGARGRSRT
jgi:hypothetical protein